MGKQIASADNAIAIAIAMEIRDLVQKSDEGSASKHSMEAERRSLLPSAIQSADNPAWCRLQELAANVGSVEAEQERALKRLGQLLPEAQRLIAESTSGLSQEERDTLSQTLAEDEESILARCELAAEHLEHIFGDTTVANP